MYIHQKQLDRIDTFITPNKVVIVLGPRRCGKTTLLQQVLKRQKENYLFVDGDNIHVRESLQSQSIEKLKTFVGEHKMLVIDEAQKIKNIGINLKLIIDHIPDIKVIATGSSAFDLAQNIGEPLTGRKYTLKMYPLSQMEIGTKENVIETAEKLEQRLIFGSYPEVVIINDRKKQELYLKEIVSSYLYRDILELDGIRHSDKIVRLLQLLAFQIGKEVSHTELGTQLGLSKNTVERYLDLLEKTFVIFRLPGFSRNLRKEISKNSRYYFIDIGIRNALINNLNDLALRNDVGMLWENYCIVERLKKQEYTDLMTNNYFWRTYDQKEIDLVEERSGKLFGYEFKWGHKKLKVPKEWKGTYKESEFEVIDRENYLPFIT